MLPEVCTDGRVAASAFAWRNGRGVHVTLVAKATFSIVPGGVATHRGPAAASADAGSGPQEPAFRPRCDVTLIGFARPAPGVAEPFVRLGLSAGVRVVLDKVVPIVAGAGVAAVQIASLGPVAPSPVDPIPRRDAEGCAELSDAVDGSAWQSAPRDQQIPFPEGGEWLVLDGVDATSPRVTTRLPIHGAVGRVRVTGGAGAVSEEEVRLHCDAIAVDVDRREITITWRGVWQRPAGLSSSACILAAALPDATVSVAWEKLWRGSMPVASRVLDDSTLLALPSDGGQKVLPFGSPLAVPVAEPAAPVAVPPVAPHVATGAPPVDDSTQQGTGIPAPWLAPFAVATPATPSSAPDLSALPWGGPVKAAHAARPGDETLGLAASPAPPPPSSVSLAERLKEMAKDPAAIRDLMARLRGP